MAERLITVATFNLPTEAYILKGRLEAEGIPCFLGDEHIISAQPLYSVAVGGVKLQVTEGDAEEALEMLARIQGGTSVYILDDNIELAPHPKIKSRRTHVLSVNPKAHSCKVYLEGRLSSLLPFVSRKLACHDCGYTWKQN